MTHLNVSAKYKLVWFFSDDNTAEEENYFFRKSHSPSLNQRRREKQKTKNQSCYLSSVAVRWGQCIHFPWTELRVRHASAFPSAPGSNSPQNREATSGARARLIFSSRGTWTWNLTHSSEWRSACLAGTHSWSKMVIQADFHRRLPSLFCVTSSPKLITYILRWQGSWIMSFKMQIGRTLIIIFASQAGTRCPGQGRGPTPFSLQCISLLLHILGIKKKINNFKWTTVVGSGVIWIL